MAVGDKKQNFQSTGSIAQDITILNSSQEELLQSIAANLTRISGEDGIRISQAALQDLVDQTKGDSDVQRRKSGSRSNRSDKNSGDKDSNYSRRNRNSRDPFDTNAMRRRGRLTANQFFDDLTDTLEDEFIKGLTGSAHPIQDALKKPIAEFANSLGVNVKDLGKEVGRRLGNQLSNAFKATDLGKHLTQQWQGIINDVSNQGAQFLRNATDMLNDPNALSRSKSNKNRRDLENESIDNVSDAFDDLSGSDGPVNQAGEALNQASDIINDSASNMSGQLQNAVGNLGNLSSSTQLANQSTAQLTSELTTAAPELAGLAGAAGPLALLIPILQLTLIALQHSIQEFDEAIQPMKEGFNNFVEKLENAGTKVLSLTARNLELAKKRFEDDARSLIEAPFKILEDAANRVLDTWDSVLHTVTATQEYNKAEVQDLWASYSQRLKDEGLSSVISSTDIMKNLEGILEKGLSGEVANEFAYIATLLNNAIPTQDFFQYAEAYASLAANYIKMGMDEQKALGFASKELKSFASNVLYASRELSGGFTTSLSNASSLFEDSVKIAMTSGNVITGEISGVLTSVSAIVGSIAPDLASGIVDAVVKAALGGNSNEITALRSMTSAGASNTAFLKALSKDPKSVFSELFSNLANLQQMSSDNFMEVAEALSSVFGISMDAFARVDFAYLADKISEMDVSFTELQDSIDLLRSEETVSTAEKLRMQQINKYMIEEGLAYVLDNEVAREVQQHMWQEQLAREIEENTFAVDLAGASLDLLKGVIEAVNNLMKKFGLPIIAIQGIELTAQELAVLGDDIKNVLEEQVVGSGDTFVLKNLITSGQDLKLIERYPQLIGLNSNYLGRDYSNSNGGIDVTSSDASLLSPEQADHIFNPTGRPISGSSVSDESSISAVSDAVPKSAASKGKYRTGIGIYYNWAPVAKTISGLFKELWSSGDWRTAASYNAIWDNEQTAIAQSEQSKVQEFLDTMQDYTKDMVALTASGGPASLAAAEARENAENKYLSQAELEDTILNSSLKDEVMSYEDWVESASKYGITNLGQTLSEYGLTMTDVESKFQQYQTQAEGRTEYARQLHEIQFWENVEEYNNNYFPNHFENEFLRKDWMENWETNYLTPIRDDLHQLLTDWEDYYIHHTAYTEATGDAFADAIELADLEKDEMGDSVLALAKALTENNNWLQENTEILKDPVVHANVLLSQILVVTEAIMQQNNSTATTSAIPTTLLGLGTGGMSEGYYGD